MPLVYPGGNYRVAFVTSNPTTGAAQDADSTPVATANRNGTDDATFTLTITHLDTGRYHAWGTIPAGYAAGDIVNVSVAATVATVAGKAIVDSFAVPAAAYAGGDTPGTTTLLSRLTAGRATNLDNIDAAVSTRSTYAGGAVASVTAPVTIGTITDKAGYSLAATGLDAVPITAPAGRAATFREVVMATYRRFYGPSVKDPAAGVIRTFADDAVTVITTQPYAEDSTGLERLGGA